MEQVMDLKQQALQITQQAIRAVLPDAAVQKALSKMQLSGRVILVAAGKAAWQMANAAWQTLSDRISGGVVITKYHHSQGEIGPLQIFEAGHPVPDENSFRATQAALAITENLTKGDTVLFLLSGGGSALFEQPLVAPGVLQNVTDQLLACGADIVQINTIRKRLSAVKGGKFALHCAPAKVYSVVLSDILGDPLDMIASGPCCADSSTCEQALTIAQNYALQLSEQVWQLLRQETPKQVTNAVSYVTGSVSELCAAAEQVCRGLGYTPVVLTDQLCCQASQAGSFLASILKTHQNSDKSLAFIAGGETVVKLTGTGKGGRNQELALSAAEGISGIPGAAVFSIGSDGTDGPTDAAGGFVDHTTKQILAQKGISISEVLRNNDAYHALEKTDGLIITGPTGTNVNDVAVALLYRP